MVMAMLSCSPSGGAEGFRLQRFSIGDAVQAAPQIPRARRTYAGAKKQKTATAKPGGPSTRALAAFVTRPQAEAQIGAKRYVAEAAARVKHVENNLLPLREKVAQA
jgi:hypothetical protein